MTITLYKRNRNGRIQEWTIETLDNTFRTIEGLIDGKKTPSEYTVCEGKNIGKKNETTPEEQAIKEAEAKAERKRESGYVNNIDNVDKVEKFEPMLANKFKKFEEECWSQPKLDGVRNILSKIGSKTRNGKDSLAVPHIYEELKWVFDAYPNIRFDGELYNHELRDNFNKLTSIARKSKPTADDLRESAEMIEYHVYDVYLGDDTIFSERIEFLREILAELNSDDTMVKLVETTLVKSSDELDEEYGKYLEQGYEGQMVRTKNSVYETKRSKFLLKRKEFMDEEFDIEDILEGLGNRSSMAGRVVLRLPDGRNFKAGIKGGVDYYIHLLENKGEYIGKQATIRFQNYTPDGIPRFPVMYSVRDYE
jgi:DNA ligase-1